MPPPPMRSISSYAPRRIPSRPAIQNLLPTASIEAAHPTWCVARRMMLLVEYFCRMIIAYPRRAVCQIGHSQAALWVIAYARAGGWGSPYGPGSSVGDGPGSDGLGEGSGAGD